MDQNAQGRRPHYNRGRRGPERRSSERRSPPPPQDQSGRAAGDQVDVEQIMRDIRARIAQRHGIELSTPQIHELAARRLEAILDPRGMNPALMEQLRRGAAAVPEPPPAAPDPGYTFEDTTLFETHRGVLRFIRRLLNPILKLFFNPTPLVHALHTQARLNREGAARESERQRLQAEWNALHYEILQRLVTEVSRVSIDMQALELRVESLSAKVDFNDRRVRSMETTSPQARAVPRAPEPAAVIPAAASAEAPAVDSSAADATVADATRRRRRRRRGRRSGTSAAESGAGTDAAAMIDSTGGEATDAEEGTEEEGAAEPATSDERPLPQQAAPAPEQVPAAPEALPPPPDTPAPPSDEPSPEARADHPDPGPADR